MNEKEFKEVLELLEQQGWQPRVCNAQVPVLISTAVCGIPSPLGDEGVEGYRKLPLPEYVKAVVVRVKGPSMVDAGFVDGDEVLVETEGEAADGDIVAALVNNECTIKVLAHDEDGFPWLVPCNETFEPIYIDDKTTLTIIGRVTNVLRRPTHRPFPELMRAINGARRKLAAGRPQRKSFAEILNPHHAEEHLSRLHTCMEGLRGKPAAFLLQTAIAMGWLTDKPAYESVAEEFGDIGSKSTFYKYLALPMTARERESAEKMLEG